MLTQVAQTSISSYHSLENEGGQVLRVAKFLINETKHWRSHSIQTIAEHFYLQGDRNLSQTGRASARLNKIKKDGVVFDRVKYRLELVDTRKNTSTNKQNEFFWLVREMPEPVKQGELF